MRIEIEFTRIMTAWQPSKYFRKKLLGLLLEARKIGDVASQVKLSRRRAIEIGTGILLAIAIALLGTPSSAQQLQITPANPKLGDTLSVNIQQFTGSAAPKVKMGDKTYQTFEIEPNTYRALLPTTPLDKPGVRGIQVITGDEVQNLTVSVANRSFPTQRIRLSGGGLEATQHELDRVNAFKQLVTPEKYWNGPFLAPNRGRISSIYGVRRYYNGVFAKDYYHRGVDYAGGYGSPVVAPAAGRVALVGRVSEGFRVHGNIVGIDHGQGVASVFLHLSRINVQEGDFVQAGQQIGAIGSTGASTGPHLHWGLYVNGQSVDPVPWRTEGVK